VSTSSFWGSTPLRIEPPAGNKDAGSRRQVADHQVILAPQVTVELSPTMVSFAMASLPRTFFGTNS